MLQITIKKIYKEYKKLKKTHNEYEAQCSYMANILSEKIEFEFFVMYQYSDGFVIVHKEDNHNAPLHSCIAIIDEKGFLSFEDYRFLCI
jgi:hypothetical protein